MNQYYGNRYDTPVEIWLEEDHPVAPPKAYVKPTSDMYISRDARDVLPNGLMTISYLKTWRHVKSLDCFININSVSFL